MCLGLTLVDSFLDACLLRNAFDVCLAATPHHTVERDHCRLDWLAATVDWIESWLFAMSCLALCGDATTYAWYSTITGIIDCLADSLGACLTRKPGTTETLPEKDENDCLVG